MKSSKRSAMRMTESSLSSMLPDQVRQLLEADPSSAPCPSSAVAALSMRRPTPWGSRASRNSLSEARASSGSTGMMVSSIGDLVAVLDQLVALLERGEQLDPALADEGLRRDRGPDVGRQRHVAVDGQGDLHPVAHDLDVGDLAGRQAEHLHRAGLVERHGAREVGDDLVGVAAADEAAAASGPAQRRAAWRRGGAVDGAASLHPQRREYTSRRPPRTSGPRPRTKMSCHGPVLPAAGLLEDAGPEPGQGTVDVVLLGGHDVEGRGQGVEGRVEASLVGRDQPVRAPGRCRRTPRGRWRGRCAGRRSARGSRCDESSSVRISSSLSARVPLSRSAWSSSCVELGLPLVDGGRRPG